MQAFYYKLELIQSSFEKPFGGTAIHTLQHSIKMCACVCDPRSDGFVIIRCSLFKVPRVYKMVCGEGK